MAHLIFHNVPASESAKVIAPLASKTRSLACRYFKVNWVLIYCHILQWQNICSVLGSDNNIHQRLPMKQLGRLFLQSPDAGVLWRPLCHKNPNQSPVTTDCDCSQPQSKLSKAMQTFGNWENLFFWWTKVQVLTVEHVTDTTHSSTKGGWRTLEI